MTNYKERLDEILDNHAQEFKAGHLGKVKQAIDRLFLDVVGYEQYPDEAKSVTYDLMVRSKLRAELRTTITGKE